MVTRLSSDTEFENLFGGSTKTFEDIFGTPQKTPESVPIQEDDPFELIQSEKDNEVSWYKAMFSGIASGVIKIPEGFVSLGAELYDLTNDTNTAAQIEQFFDTINPFEEIAEQHTIGKLTELITQFGIPASLGARVATKIADKALKAKRAGVYANLKSENMKKATNMVRKELIKKQNKYRIGAGVMGIGAGEALVAGDRTLEETGSFFSGDIVGTNIPYPLAYDPVEVYGELPSGSEEALRRLKNRGKWGVEGGLFVGALGALGKGAKTLYKRGKDLAYSNSGILRALDKVGEMFRPRGAAAPELFTEARAFKGQKTAQENLSQELVRDFDNAIDALFPIISRNLYASTKKERQAIYAAVNDMLKTYQRGVPDERAAAKLTALLENTGASRKEIENVFGTVGNMRDFLDNYLLKIGASPTWGDEMTEAAAELWKRTQMGIGNYLEETYQFMNKSADQVLDRSKAGVALKNKMIQVLKEHARSKNYPLNDLEANAIIKNIIKSGAESTPKQLLQMDELFWSLNKLDFGSNPKGEMRKLYEALFKTEGDRKQILTKLKETFGTSADPRMNFLNTSSRLISTAATDKFYQQLLTQARKTFNAGVIRNEAGEIIGYQGKRPVLIPGDEIANLGATEREALVRSIFPNQEVTEMTFAHGSKAGQSFLTNPLAGSFTTKKMANLLEQYPVPAWRQDPAIQFFSQAYKYAGLLPKAAVNISKTVLGPFTHGRNALSAGAFAFANGTFFENPKTVTQALTDALATTQGPFKRWNTKGANQRYQKLVELGVVNTNVRLGDIMRLVDDIGFAGGPLSYAGTTKPLKAWGKLMKGAQDAYVAEDDFWKITNFAMERMKLKRKFPNYTDDMLDQQAAKIVRDTVPNYEYVGLFQRGLRYSPIGNFVSFPSEMIRTSFNIAEQGMKEVSRGLKTGNANDVADGMKRLVGFSTGALMGGELLTNLGMSAYNISQDELNAIRRFVAPWAEDAPLMPMGQDEDGNYKYIDLGNILAYETVVEPVRAIMLELAAGEDDPDRLMKHLRDGSARAAFNVLEPFVSESIWFGLLFDLVGRDGRTREGKRIWNPIDPWGDKISKALNYAVVESLPGNYKQMKRIFESRNGEQYDFDNEMWGTVGMRQQVVQPEAQMPFKINDYIKNLTNARKYYTTVAYEGNKEFPDENKYTPEGLIEGYRAFLQGAFDAQKNLYQDIQAAKTLGATDAQIEDAFEGRIRPAILDSILDGKFYGYELSGGALDAMYNNAREKGLINPYSTASSKLDSILSVNDGKDLITDAFDPLRDKSTPSQESFENLFPQSNIGTQTTPIKQSYTRPGLVLSQQGQNQYNPATGLTRTETALLSPSDQVIRKKQRGII